MEPDIPQWSFVVCFHSNVFHVSHVRRELEGFSSLHVTVPSRLVCVLCQPILSVVVLIWIAPCNIRSGKQLFALCIVPLGSSLSFLSACVPGCWYFSACPQVVFSFFFSHSLLLLLQPLTRAPNNRWRNQLCMFKTQTHPQRKKVCGCSKTHFFVPDFSSE